MHLRTTTVRSGSKTYRYHQLVESVRKPGGAVSKRVIASLGELSEIELSNLQAALEASRRELRVALVVPDATAAKLRAPDASLAYLDIAALLEVWNDAGFAALIDDIIPRGGADVPPADVIAALAVHRCVAGRSKLHAERWLPSTALPELLAISPDAFHNTRLHRVLDQLHEASADIQRRLPTAYGLKRQAVAAFYLDITDTWFVGHGPELAKAGRTKDDAIRHKVGIVLLCTDDGRPLRWEVLSGDRPEAPAMLDLLRTEAWTRGAGPPVVIDRAMGSTAYIKQLLAADVPFLTAMTRSEFAAYAPKLPCATLDDVFVPSSATPANLAPIRAALVNAGMTEVDHDLLFVDFGVIGRPSEADGGAEVADGPEASPDADLGAADVAVDAADPGPALEDRKAGWSKFGPGRAALELARKIQADVEVGLVTSRRAAGARRGLTLADTKRVCRMLKLSSAAQDALLGGEAEHVSFTALREIVLLPEDAHRDAVLAKEGVSRDRGRPALRERVVQPTEPAIPRVRAVGYFNPEVWWQQRRAAAARLRTVSKFVADFNDELRSPRSRRSPEQVRAHVLKYLGRTDHITAFDVTVGEADCDGRDVLEVTLTPNADWKRRRRLDGFSVLVAHPTIALPPVDLVRRYRAKDVIEKDFQTIKSLVRLRPVWHHNDAKVRAHVTLCMLALALERELHRRLKGAASVAAALELWSSVRLQRYAPTTRDGDVYTLTRPDPDQAKLLTTAALSKLVSDKDLASRITPRSRR